MSSGIFAEQYDDKKSSSYELPKQLLLEARAEVRKHCQTDAWRNGRHSHRVQDRRQWRIYIVHTRSIQKQPSATWLKAISIHVHAHVQTLSKLRFRGGAPTKYQKKYSLILKVSVYVLVHVRVRLRQQYFALLTHAPSHKQRQWCTSNCTAKVINVWSSYEQQTHPLSWHRIRVSNGAASLCFLYTRKVENHFNPGWNTTRQYLDSLDFSTTNRLKCKC